ncbi:MAG TPA: cytochrome P450 [Nitrososphaerales archaeon]|nr:cytochrome P450 [Nitrososphaerales archaeon]
MSSIQEKKQIAKPELTGKKPPKVVVAPSTNIIGTVTRVGRKYPEMAHLRSPLFDFYLASDPELIQEILVTHHKNFVKGDFLQRTKKVFGEGLLTSEGDFHHRQRRLVQPAFNHARIAGYADVMNYYTDRVLGEWKDGEILDIHEEMTRLTMAIVAKCLFNEDVEVQSSSLSQSLTDIIEYFNRLSSPLSWLLEKLPSNGKYNAAVEKVDRMVYRMIEDRLKTGKDPGDLLSMLLAARDLDGSAMSQRQVRDEALILFAAGHETTANALSWTWYLVSQHSELADKLREEVDLSLGSRSPTYADVPNLTYTTNVFTEGMRLYPPAWILTRQAIADCTIGEYAIPSGTDVLLSQYVLHHDPRFYKDPEKFDPDRWTKEMRANLPRFAYFPFGGGPRSCVGEPFAWMEGALIISRMAQKWNLSLAETKKVEMLPRITLRPKNGIKMKVTKRKE